MRDQLIFYVDAVLGILKVTFGITTESFTIANVDRRQKLSLNIKLSRWSNIPHRSINVRYDYEILQKSCCSMNYFLPYLVLERKSIKLKR